MSIGLKSSIQHIIRKFKTSNKETYLNSDPSKATYDDREMSGR